MKYSKLFIFSILAFSFVCLAGCGEDKEYRKVTGVVTQDGQPVEGAVLMFYAEESGGEGGSGKTDATGAFVVTSPGAKKGGSGLKPGSYKVTVAKYEDVVNEDEAAYQKGEITYDELQERKAKAGAYVKAQAAALLTPPKFANTNDTPLKVTVSNNPKDNAFDFKLDAE